MKSPLQACINPEKPFTKLLKFFEEAAQTYFLCLGCCKVRAVKLRDDRSYKSIVNSMVSMSSSITTQWAPWNADASGDTHIEAVRPEIFKGSHATDAEQYFSLGVTRGTKLSLTQHGIPPQQQIEQALKVAFCLPSGPPKRDGLSRKTGRGVLNKAPWSRFWILLESRTPKPKHIKEATLTIV